MHLDNYVSFSGSTAIQLPVLLHHHNFSFFFHFMSVFFHMVQNPPVVLLGYTHKLFPRIKTVIKVSEILMYPHLQCEQPQLSQSVSTAEELQLSEHLCSLLQTHSNLFSFSRCLKVRGSYIQLQPYLAIIYFGSDHSVHVLFVQRRSNPKTISHTETLTLPIRIGDFYCAI